jgi:hypothetical protein
MEDGEERTARQVLDAIMNKWFDSGNRSTIYVPEHRKICHYLKANRKYLAIRKSRYGIVYRLDSVGEEE